MNEGEVKLEVGDYVNRSQSKHHMLPQQWIYSLVLPIPNPLKGLALLTGIKLPRLQRGPDYRHYRDASQER